MENATIRKELIKMRESLNLEYIKEHSLKMTEDIISDEHYKNSDTIYIYLPIRNEIDTEYIIRRALHDGKTVAVPVVLTSGDMVFESIEGNPGFHKDRYQILEPKYNPMKIVDKPGLMIVPVVAFKGNKRLGYGRQYYNNYLGNRKNLYTIGVGYDFQECQDISFDDRDISLDENRSY